MYQVYSKTIPNTATNYFAKNTRLKKAEIITGQKNLHYLIEDRSNLALEMVRIQSENTLLDFRNPYLASEFLNLSDGNKTFLIRKYILGYSDYEISVQLSLSRQGATKKRQRILKKFANDY
ncbi:hypothetical protein IGI65_001947 [Enterococcus sp. DIV0755b]|uniref:sigma-70 family RNA polymerase sigma factor n=1 Tax=Enterococcus sp. DIV0755b TaxID=2774657 RepID=UPI003F23F968